MRGANRVQAFTIDTTILVSTTFSLWLALWACLERPAIYRSSTTRSNVVLGCFLKHAETRRKDAETAMPVDIAGIAGGKVTNQWGIKAFLLQPCRYGIWIPYTYAVPGQLAICLFEPIFF